MRWLLVILAGCSSSESGSVADAARDSEFSVDTNSDGSKPIFESCADGVKNGVETDVDCGGTECAPCKVSSDCIRNEDCEGVCRATECALPRSCAELRRPGIKSGIYELEVEGSKLPFYCDMTTDEGGYTLVFKLNSGGAAQPASLWTSGMPLNDDDRAVLGPNKGSKNYLSRVATKLWNLGFAVDEVRVSLMIAGKEIKFFKFDARGSSVVNWFVPARISASSYTDVGATMTTNIFSIAGDAASHREWFISKAYGGCEIDSGWLVTDWAPDPCAWESSSPALRILFAPGTTAASWTTSPSRADAMLVFVR